MKQDKVERQKHFEIDVTFLTSEMLGRVILSRLETSRALVVPIYEGDNSMDKVEQVARIIDNALMADMVDGRFDSIGYARQIVALFEPASPEMLLTDEEKYLLDCIKLPLTHIRQPIEMLILHYDITFEKAVDIVLSTLAKSEPLIRADQKRID